MNDKEESIEKKSNPESLGDILIVDDTLANLELLRKLLVKAGYTVRGAINGPSAIMACKTQPPMLILLDIVMPEMDGYTICKKLKEDDQTKNIPIIFISALGMLDDQVKGFKLGGVDFITKPFQPEEVLVSVNTHLQLYKLQQDLEQLVHQRTLALQKSNTALIKSEGQYRGLVENTSDWIWEINEHEIYTYSSPQTLEIIGYHSEYVVGKTFCEFVQQNETGYANLNCQALIAKCKPFKVVEKNLINKNGQNIVIESSAVPIFDEKGIYRGHRGVDRDITDRKVAEDKMKFLAQHDLLTQLPNRFMFNEQLNQAILLAAADNHRIAVLFLDLNRFKDINETFGHLFGDQLLIQVGKRLSQVRHKFDALAHFGADEFALMIYNFESTDKIKDLAETLLNLMVTPFSIEGQEIFLDTSIGISLYPKNGDLTLVLCRDANSALNLAKEKGRNNYQFYTDDLTQAAAERLSLATRLRHAIEKDEFQLFYQPQIELKSNRIIGAEALIRWINPIYGLIPPDKFIPLAEDTGLILPIGEWVLHEACRQFSQWNNEGISLARVSVNISGLQIQRTDLPLMVAQALADYKIQPGCLDLEVTESILMNNPQYVTEVLTALRKLGVSLAVDDFGTGYSSLSYLKHFPINMLKIDRSFVLDIPANKDDVAIAQAIIGMSNSLQLKTLAEGIETKEQRDFLIKEGCEYGQGYLYSRPLPVDEFYDLLVKGISI